MPVNSTESWALAYARAGHPVFPIWGMVDGRCVCGTPCGNNKGKHPITPNGFKDATTDESIILAWLAQHPTMNLGLPTGLRFDVLDVDVKNDGPASLERLCKDLEIAFPETVTAKTGGGGNHYGFKPRLGLKSGTDVFGKRYPGLDVRASGGYIVCPPSIHASGNPYGWVKGLGLLKHELAEWPSEILAAMGRRRDHARGDGPQAPRDDGLHGVRQSKNGGRNQTMVEWVGRWIAQGLSKEQVLVFALVRDSTNEPPLGTDTVTNMVERLWLKDSAKPKVYHFGDGGVSDRFRDHYQDALVYCPDWKCWVYWSGQRWERDNGDGTYAHGLMERLTRSLYEQAARTEHEESRRALVKEAKRCESLTARRHALEDAELKMAVKPEVFDADPNLLAFENGVLDLGAMSFREHRKTDFITKWMAGPYEPGYSPGGLWNIFMAEAVPDHATREYIQAAVGYAVMGLGNARKAFFVHGPKGSGKSTFTTSIRNAFGEYGASVDPSTLAAFHTNGGAARTDLIRLKGVRLMIVPELPPGMVLNAALVKTFTGGDAIVPRALYRANVEFTPVAVPWLTGNDAPRAPHEDAAFWERLRRIPFDQERKDAEQDKSIKERLNKDPVCRVEILNWIVEGITLYREQGLNAPPETIQASTDAWRGEQDPLGTFLGEFHYPKDGFVQSIRLDKLFSEWLEDNGERMEKRVLIKRIKALGVKNGLKKIHGLPVRGWHGMGEKPKGGRT